MVIQNPEESLSSKYFCIIVLHDCVPKQLAPTSERSDSIYCVTSALSEAQIILYHIRKLLYSLASLIFLVIFSATVYQEVLFDSLYGNGDLLFIRMCFAHVKFESLDGNIASELRRNRLDRAGIMFVTDLIWDTLIFQTQCRNAMVPEMDVITTFATSTLLATRKMQLCSSDDLALYLTALSEPYCVTVNFL